MVYGLYTYPQGEQVSMCRSEDSGMLLNQFPLIPGSLNEPYLRLVSSKLPCSPSLGHPQCWSYSHRQAHPAFYTGGGDLNSGPHVSAASEPPPSLPLFVPVLSFTNWAVNLWEHRRALQAQHMHSRLYEETVLRFLKAHRSTFLKQGDERGTRGPFLSALLFNKRKGKPAQMSTGFIICLFIY